MSRLRSRSGDEIHLSFRTEARQHRYPSRQASLDPVAIEVTRFTCPRAQAFIFDVGRDAIRNLLSWRKLRLLRSRWTLRESYYGLLQRHGTSRGGGEGLR